MKKICSRCAAFTLSEVLIAIGIIAIVAALTIPSLINVIGNKVKEHQISVFEKNYGKVQTYLISKME